jgi:hypothetical protein
MCYVFFLTRLFVRWEILQRNRSGGDQRALPQLQLPERGVALSSASLPVFARHLSTAGGLRLGREEERLLPEIALS